MPVVHKLFAAGALLIAAMACSLWLDTSGEISPFPVLVAWTDWKGIALRRPDGMDVRTKVVVRLQNGMESGIVESGRHLSLGGCVIAAIRRSRLSGRLLQVHSLSGDADPTAWCNNPPVTASRRTYGGRNGPVYAGAPAAPVSAMKLEDCGPPQGVPLHKPSELPSLYECLKEGTNCGEPKPIKEIVRDATTVVFVSNCHSPPGVCDGTGPRMVPPALPCPAVLPRQGAP